ncbi:hypothetical protein BH23BAC1_BH23BAC1_00620 [soil metagenome]
MKTFIIIFLLFLSLNLKAQEKNQIQAQDYQNTQVEMADTFRQDGKIYVVVTVITIVLAGLIIYVVSLDKKISGIEKEFGIKNPLSTKADY